MAKSALLPIQAALYSVLTGDATLTGMVSGVFDHVPDGSAFPYVAIADFTENPFGTFGRNGKQVTATLHIWSRYQGFREAYLILDRVNELLDQQDLAVAGFTTVWCSHENTQTLTDADGATRHLVVRYRLIVSEA